MYYSFTNRSSTGVSTPTSSIFFLIIKLLKHHHGVLAFVQIAAGKIERLLSAYLPVATEINAIDKDYAWALQKPK